MSQLQATILVFLLSLVLVATQVDEEEVKASHKKYADMIKHDGKSRVKVITPNNVKSILKKNDIVVVFFWVDNNKKLEKLNQQDMDFLETVAQSFEQKKVVITTCEIMANQEFASKAELRFSGMIKLFHGGQVQTYGGQRSPDVLIPYLFKMLTPSVIEIKNKAGKKNFDKIQLVKVVAYLKDKSKELKAFREISYKFHPMIPFYYVTDAKLAKVFHLKKKNSLLILKQFEKSISFPSKEKLTSSSILNFVTENKRERLVKMKLENLHDIWAIDLKGYLITVFTNTKSEEGGDFLSKCRKLSKHFEKNLNLTFVWIDPEPFPSMVDYWRKSFGIDPMIPNLGVVDIHTQQSTWYTKEDGKSDQVEIKAMIKWLSSVYDKNIELVAMDTGSKEPYKGDEKTEAKKEEL